ncbi:hypothetical protein [Zooshikella ganghwensis]|uniref:Uncharacterized protein n=1 Tax=Zooshikella ganghwensis TaxID=202772 RepID=A0A4P9VRG1_9GAMM|nr:hypothetical protein [Zooshikella ganghwensis]RDH46178.1 hypothetical protein B9G39_23515 [Zooshikella ganghwensis]
MKICNQLIFQCFWVVKKEPHPKAFHDHSTKVLTRAGDESRRLYKDFCKKLLNQKFKKPIQRYELQEFMDARKKSNSAMFKVIEDGINQFQNLYPTDYKTMFDGIQGSFTYTDHDDYAVSPDYWVKYYRTHCY